MAKKKTEKIKLKTERVACYHIGDSMDLNMTARTILEKITNLAEEYRVNKHRKKKLQQVSLRPNDFNKLIKSTNSMLSKSQKPNIETNHLMYLGINIVPTQITD